MLSNTAESERIALDGPVVEVSERGAHLLADAYWDEIRRLTLGTVRVHSEIDGIDVVFVGLIPLLRFGNPETVAAAGHVECRFPIIGGLLVKRPGGTFSIAQRACPTLELVLTVEGYVPRLDSGRSRGGLRTFAYRELQRRAHAAIGRRYLARMAGDRR